MKGRGIVSDRMIELRVATRGGDVSKKVMLMPNAQ